MKLKCIRYWPKIFLTIPIILYANSLAAEWRIDIKVDQISDKLDYAYARNFGVDEVENDGFLAISCEDMIAPQFSIMWQKGLLVRSDGNTVKHDMIIQFGEEIPIEVEWYASGQFSFATTVWNIRAIEMLNYDKVAFRTKGADGSDLTLVVDPLGIVEAKDKIEEACNLGR